MPYAEILLAELIVVGPFLALAAAFGLGRMFGIGR